MAILVTGGAGYIGSHMTRALLDRGRRDVVVLDSNEAPAVGVVPAEVPLVEDDLSNLSRLTSLLQRYEISTVVHFAGHSRVEESVADPAKYLRGNTTRGATLARAATTAGVGAVVFSSTAAVYGHPDTQPIAETSPTEPRNPYGLSKLLAERLFARAAETSGSGLFVLRYFNVAGAAYGVGESHSPETHLIPRVVSMAAGGERVQIFGDDYPTPDGTCVRDYVHVADLVEAHVAAIDLLEQGAKGATLNLGAGVGVSVREVIETIRDVTGIDIQTEVRPRRPGDPPTLVADVSRAREVLGWSPRRGLREVVASAWRWAQSAGAREIEQQRATGASTS